jgi:RNA polymerase sigma-70 factor (ECF subfamily)
MSETELISACLKNDQTAQKQFFDTFYPRLAYISLRYSKNKSQSAQIVLNGFTHIFENLQNFRTQKKYNLEEYVKHEFISFTVKHIKGIRNEYYVASTVRAVENKETSYDLFFDNQLIDFKNLSEDVLLRSIQQLVPSQRLVFNLHVVDSYTLEHISELLETSIQTLKSNLEKARFNLQKSIEKNLKTEKDEQPI